MGVRPVRTDSVVVACPATSIVDGDARALCVCYAIIVNAVQTWVSSSIRVSSGAKWNIAVSVSWVIDAMAVRWNLRFSKCRRTSSTRMIVRSSR